MSTSCVTQQKRRAYVYGKIMVHSMVCRLGMIKNIFVEPLLFFYLRPLNYIARFSIAAIHHAGWLWIKGPQNAAYSMELWCWWSLYCDLNTVRWVTQGLSECTKVDGDNAHGTIFAFLLSSNEEIMVAYCQKTAGTPNKVLKRFRKCVRRYSEPETVRHGRNYRAG